MGVGRRQPLYVSILREKPEQTRPERRPHLVARERAVPGVASEGRCTARTASGTCKRAGPYVRREARESAVAAQRREAGDDVRPGTTDMSDRRLGDGPRELHAGVA